MRKPQLTYTFAQDPHRRSWIYAIQSGNLTKVGMTTNPEARLETMRLYNPHPLKVVMYRTVRYSVARIIEKRIHELLAPFAKGREWFDAPLAEIRAATKQAMKEAAVVERAEISMLIEHQGHARMDPNRVLDVDGELKRAKSALTQGVR